MAGDSPVLPGLAGTSYSTSAECCPGRWSCALTSAKAKQSSNT